MRLRIYNNNKGKEAMNLRGVGERKGRGEMIQLYSKLKKKNPSNNNKKNRFPMCLFSHCSSHLQINYAYWTGLKPLLSHLLISSRGTFFLDESSLFPQNKMFNFDWVGKMHMVAVKKITSLQPTKTHEILTTRYMWTRIRKYCEILH